MFVIEEESDIAAKPEKIFSILTNLKEYSKWNPWIYQAEGLIEEGNKVTVWLSLNGKKKQFHHRIVKYAPPYHFHWCDLGIFTIFAFGQRIRTLNSSRNGTHYKVTLKINGIFSGISKKIFGKSLKEGLKAETEALKLYAEKTESNP